MDKSEFRDHVRKIIFGLLCLSFFIPFIHLPYDARGLEYYIYCTLAVLLIILWSLYGILRIRMNRTDILLLLFIGWLTIRLAIKDPVLLLNERYLSLALLPAIYFAFKQFRGIGLFVALLLSGVLQNILGLLQLSGLIRNSDPYFLVGGAFGNPGVFAGYIVSVIPFALAFMIRVNGWKKRPLWTAIWWLCLLFLLFSLILLPVTGSRAAWLACLAGCSVVLFYTQRKKIAWLSGSRLKKTLLLAVIPGLVLPAGWFLLQYKKGSAEGRALIWKVSAGMLFQHPVFGIGFTGFEAEYNNYQERYFVSAGAERSDEKDVADNSSTAFDEFLEMAIEEGIAGLVLFLAFLLLLFQANAGRTFLIAARASIGTILVFALTSYPFHTQAILVHFFFAAALLSTGRRRISGRSITARKKGQPHSIAWRIAIVLIAFPLLLYTACKLPAVQQLQNLAKQVNGQDPALSQKILNNLSPLVRTDNDYLVCQSIIYYRLGAFKESVRALLRLKQRISGSEIYVLLGNDLKALGNYEQAREAYNYAANMVPTRFLPKYLLMRLFIDTGRTEEAVRVGGELLAMKEKIPSVEVQQMRFFAQNFIHDNRPHND